MTTLLLFFVALIFNEAIGQQYAEWTGESLAGKKIRIQSINTDQAVARSPPLWLFSSPDWPWWSRNVLAGTADTSKNITWKVTSITPVKWTSAAVSSYNYIGYSVTLSSVDDGTNVYDWQTNLQTGTGPATPIIFANTTYTTKVVNPPFIYLAKPDQWYPSGFTGGGATALITANAPIGHFSWDTQGGSQKALYKIYVEVPSTIAADEVRIWSCTKDAAYTVYFDPAVIQTYAQTAIQLTIRSILDPANTYVTTTSPIVLDQLRLGKTISFSPTGGYADPTQWSGPMVSKLWNSCGSASAFTDTAYWACNNGNGLHLTSQICRWDISTPTIGGIEIIIKRKLDEFVPLYRCTTDTSSYYLAPTPAAVTAIGNAADTISIYSTNARSTEYVNTGPGSYALKSLSNVMTLSYKSDNSYADVNGWTGTKTANLWNSCGNSVGFFTKAYWACNNGNGLHLMSDTCRWSISTPGPTGGITIAVKPKTIAPYRLVRIYSCTSNTQNEYVYTIDQIKSLASIADGITIMSRKNPNEFVTTASSNAYPLASLKLGLSLAWTSTSGYAVVSDWVGTMTDKLWNSCGSQVPFTTAPYWACNNGKGLHIKNDACTWDLSSGVTPDGGIGVYLRISASAIPPTGISFEDAESVVSLGGVSEQSALSPGAIIGIAGGSVVGIALIITIIVVVVKVKNAEVKSVDYERML